jgi:hypothetical protein
VQGQPREDVVGELNGRGPCRRDQIAVGNCRGILIKRRAAIVRRLQIVPRIARVAFVIQQTGTRQTGGCAADRGDGYVCCEKLPRFFRRRAVLGFILCGAAG